MCNFKSATKRNKPKNFLKRIQTKSLAEKQKYFMVLFTFCQLNVQKEYILSLSKTTHWQETFSRTLNWVLI